MFRTTQPRGELWHVAKISLAAVMKWVAARTMMLRAVKPIWFALVVLGFPSQTDTQFATPASIRPKMANTTIETITTITLMGVTMSNGKKTGDSPSPTLSLVLVVPLVDVTIHFSETRQWLTTLKTF